MKFHTNIRVLGNDILYIGYNNNQRIQKKIPYKPFLYTLAKSSYTAESSYGEKLAKIDFESIKDAKEHIKTYSGVSGYKLFGTNKFDWQFISEEYNHREIEFNLKTLRIFSIDLEVNSSNGFPEPDIASEEITAITVHDSKTNKYYIWSYGDFANSFRDTDYFKCKDELDLINSFIEFWEQNYPDIVTGWNIRGFDMPYLVNRITNLLNKHVRRLSPWGLVKTVDKKVKKFGKYQDTEAVDIIGINILDYMDLYQKYASKQESYKLDYIAHVELGEGKVHFSEKLHELYENDFQKFIEYNRKDVNLIVRLEERCRYIELISTVFFEGKLGAIGDAMGPVKWWECCIFHQLASKNTYNEIKDGVAEKNDKYEGAFVKEPIQGMHKWVVSFDLTSLYPTIIRQVNIGPETIANQTKHNFSIDALLSKQPNLSFLKYEDLSLAANGMEYTRNKKSFLSELMEEFFNKRKVYKNKMLELEREYEKTKDSAIKIMASQYDTKQHAVKILINSAYGALGNQYFQYFDIRNAEAITVTGKLIILWAEKSVTEFLNKTLGSVKDRVIGVDTDSLYICFDDLVKKIKESKPNITHEQTVDLLDKYCATTITKVLNDAYYDLFEYMNHKEHLMNMKREIISDVGVWTGKKHYFMNVWDKEGTRYKEPKLKAMGMAMVKSDTPYACRDKLKKVLQIILNKTETDLQKFIEDFDSEYETLPIEDIAFPKRANDIDKYFISEDKVEKACPIHVRAAIVWNNWLTKKSLDKRYEKLYNGDSLKYIYLKLPNSLKSDIFGFNSFFPREADYLKKNIDYKTQFYKSFLKPIEDICEVIGWKTKEEYESFM